MTRLIHLVRLIERRIGNVGLGILAGIIFVAAITGAAALSDTKSASTSLTTTTVSAVSTTAVDATTTTAVTTTSSTTPGETTTTVARSGLDGLSAVNFTVTPAGSKTPKKFCGLLAATPEQQEHGLMNRSDLAGYDGMLFTFPSDTRAQFYMANVPVPLSIAWFDKSGKYVSSAEMPPCTVEASKCTLYSATKPYRTAIETMKGGLSDLGISSGSVLTIGQAGTCT